jgi:hypothetical protein
MLKLPENHNANSINIFVGLLGLMVFAFIFAMSGKIVEPVDTLIVAQSWYSGEYQTTWEFLTQALWDKLPIVAVMATGIWLFAVSIRRREESAFTQ